MTAPPILQRALNLGWTVASALSFIAPLITRITLGFTFFLTGRGKLLNFQNTVTFFTELGLPMPELNAHLVSRLEYYGGILLIVGLFTRLVAAGLAGTMVGALATAERSDFLKSWDPEFEKGPMDIDAWVILMLLSWLTLFGPGLASLDALLCRLLGLKPTEPKTTEPKAAA